MADDLRIYYGDVRVTLRPGDPRIATILGLVVKDAAPPEEKGCPPPAPAPASAPTIPIPTSDDAFFTFVGHYLAMRRATTKAVPR